MAGAIGRPLLSHLLLFFALVRACSGELGQLSLTSPRKSGGSFAQDGRDLVFDYDASAVGKTKKRS